MPTAILTIGYEGRSLGDFVETLSRAGVQTLVDVRELPLSRKRGFSKTALSEALVAAGIEYEHVKALGNPKPYRDLYKSGRRDEGEAAYRRHLHNRSYSALLDLAASVTTTRTCLLCFERVHELCHRAIITEALEGELDEVVVERL